MQRSDKDLYGGGQVVSIFTFYSNDSSSNPAEAFSFFCNIVFEKHENKQKEAGVGPLFKERLAKSEKVLPDSWPKEIGTRYQWPIL